MKFTWYSNCFPIVVQLYDYFSSVTGKVFSCFTKSIESIYVFLRGTVIVSFLLMLVLRKAREKRFCLLFTLEGFGLNYFLT